MDIGTLVMKITTDSKQFESSMKNVKKTLDVAGKAVLGATGAFAAGGAAMFGMATKAAQATDRIDKMSQKIGLSRKGFQEWDFILSQNGASIDSMQSGMKTLTNQFDGLMQGTSSSVEAFERLNLSVEDLQGLTQEQIFEKTIVALQGMENETERAALANQLLGRSGSELAPLLNAGADSVEKMKTQAHDLGLVIGDEAVDAGVKFTDTMDQMKRMVGAVGTQVGTSLMPVIQSFLEWIQSHMPTIKKVSQATFDGISFVVTTVVDLFNTYLLPILTNLYDWIQSNMPTIQTVATESFQKIIEIATKLWEWFKEFILPIFVALYELVKDLFPKILKFGTETFEKILETAEPLWEFFDKWILPVIENLYKTVERSIPLLGPIFEAAFKIIGNVIEVVTGTVVAFVNAIDAALTAFEKFKSVSGAVDKAQGGTLSGNLKQFTAGQRAFGGSVMGGSSYLVGERGPELFTPGTNGKVTNMGANVTIHVSGSGDPNAVAQAIVHTLRAQGVTP